MHKISFTFVKMLQVLFRDFHMSAFFICCEQARHPTFQTIDGNTIGKIFFLSLYICQNIHVKLKVILSSSLFYTAV